METLNHVFLTSDTARFLWNNVCPLLKMPCPQGVSELFNSVLQLRGDKIYKQIICFVINMVVWEIWIRRNRLKHENKKITDHQILENVKGSTLKVFQQCVLGSTKASNFLHRLTDGQFSTAIKPSFWKIVCWQNPPSGRLKLNTDGSCRSGSMAGGAILRNHFGQVIWAKAFKFTNGTSIVAKTITLLTALRGCIGEDVFQLKVEVDSLFLVHIVYNRISCPWHLYRWVIEIRHHIGRLQASLSHVYRQGNSAADFLSNQGHLGDFLYSNVDLSLHLRSIVRLDRTKFPTIRAVKIL